MRPYITVYFDTLPNCLVFKCKEKLYVYVLYFTDQKISLLICASLNQTAKLGLFDR